MAQIEVQSRLVSTVIPVHNRPALLAQAVESVLSQTYRPIEVVIVDDGSTDQTYEVALALESANPGVVHALRQENGGPGEARERGRCIARGEFIQYLDSDDLLLPSKFARQVAKLDANPEAGICYGLTIDHDPQSGKPRPTHGTEVRHHRLAPAIFRNRIWHTASPLYRRSASDAIGAWSHRRIHEDWDYDMRAALLNIPLAYCADPVAVIRDGGDMHAGLAWQHDPRAMRDRLEGYADAIRYATLAGLPRSSPEVRQLAQTAFWAARDAGASGFVGESRRLFDLARETAGGAKPAYWIFSVMAHAVGWQVTCKLARMSDRWRAWFRENL